jgi:tetratricopeptide (TPR) repeat protein
MPVKAAAVIQGVGLLLVTVVSTAAAQATKAPQSSPLKAGIAQFDAERLDQAKATLTPLAKAGDADAMLYLGRIAIEQSDGDSAVSWIEQAARKNERSSLYQQWLAVAYSTKAASGGMLAQMSLAPSMRRAMERAVELDSANIEARVNLTQFYLQAPPAMGGGVDKAREQVAAIMARDPYLGRLLEASVAENQKDSVAAERVLRGLVASFPDSSAPAVRLAIFDYNLKRWDDAFRVVEDRLRRAPNDAAALFQLGRIGAVSGMKLDRAQWALGLYLKTPHKRGTPSIAAAHWRMGMVLEATGDKGKARSEYEWAVQLDPKLAGAKASLDKLK